MLRRIVPPCTTFAPAPRPRGREGVRPLPPGARRIAAAARIAIAPFAVILAALAGIVFVLLLPICGIASIAEGTARFCWSAAREALARGGRGAVSHH